MNKLLLALSAATIAATATPALADHVLSGKRTGVDARIASLETRYHDGIASGRIDRTEARSLRQQIVALDGMATDYKSDGLTAAEQRTLRRQIDYTRGQLQRADESSPGYALWRDGQQRFGLRD